MHTLFIQYCAYFNGNKDYFECHEVLEEYWKEIAPGDREHILVGFVQLATGLYHWRRDNHKGALRTLQKAYKCLQKKSSFFTVIHQAHLLKNIEKALLAIEENKAFQAFQLEFINFSFEQRVEQQIAMLEPMTAEFLKNKHRLRDRSSIVAERLAKLNATKESL